MSAITLDLPDDVAEQLRSVVDRLPRIIELGLRQLDEPAPVGFRSMADVLEFLAGLPSPEETLALRPTPAFSARVRELLEKSRTGVLSSAEEDEWRRYEYTEHLVRLAKAKAALKLRP